MKKSILIISILLLIMACTMRYPPVKTFDTNDQPAVRNAAITFSGYYLPPTGTPQLEDPVTDKHNYRFRIISRELLGTDASEAPAFGYYAYLIFTDQSDATLPMRQAAAQAFMCHFEEPDQARIVGLSSKNNATFYAPIKPGTVPDIRQEKSGEALLNNYDYHFAQTLVDNIRRSEISADFTVGIIAYPEPLGLKSQDFIVEEWLKIISLDDMPPAQIGAVIRKLRLAVLDKDHITALSVPENSETADYPLFVDVAVDNFPAIFRTTLQSVQNLMPQVETVEVASIHCH